MLSEDKNLQLTQVGPGTPMGEVLRRHWHPIAGVDELDRQPIKVVRLLSEDLVLFKDLSGEYGLTDRIADRTQENLGASDRGIAMLRRQLFNDIDAVQAGRDPKGVLRDPVANQRVFLPSDSRDFFLQGLPLAEYQRHPKWARLLRHFIFHAGQPDWVQQAHQAATGVTIEPLNVIDL